MKKFNKFGLELTAAFLFGVGVIVFSNVAFGQTVTDVTKQVINKTPYQVEVCTNQRVSGDKTGDTLMGALIGGAIGNNVTKNVENGGAVGALLGGMMAHNNSKATGGTRRVCNVETRYNETVTTVYSHSVVTFTHEGKSYSLSFNK
tara:strand:- start:266 stop:703 length:438 start_codon:yes stop_codon:yes gene_type:complete